MRNILLFLVGFCLSCEPKESRDVELVHVFDGDSFVVRDVMGEYDTIRVQGIDCPERAQAHAKIAKNAAIKKLGNANLQLESHKRDRYGRALARVFILDQNGEKRDFAFEMILEGHCWQYAQYDKSKRLRNAQHKAQEDKLGLWALPNPIAPWEFRRKKRNPILAQ